MNTGFVVYNTITGIIVSSGVCATSVLELNNEPGCSVLAHDLPMISREHIVVDGVIVEGAPAIIEPVTPFDLSRARAYPSIADQLDSLWHAMNDGLLPKIEPMYTEVLNVKLKMPKPT